MGARRGSGTRDLRPSVRPPPGCGPRLTALPPGRAALGRGTVSLGLRDGAATLRLREGHEALLLPRLPAAEARPQLQALLFAMAARVRDLEERLEGAAAGRGGGRGAGGSRPSEGPLREGGGGSLQHPPSPAAAAVCPRAGPPRNTSGRRSPAWKAHSRVLTAPPCAEAPVLTGRSPRGGGREEGAVWPCRAGNCWAGAGATCDPCSCHTVLGTLSYSPEKNTPRSQQPILPGEWFWGLCCTPLCFLIPQEAAGARSLPGC